MSEERSGGFRTWLADPDNLSYVVALVGVLFFLSAIIVSYGFGL